jgi:hypothetical protein
VLGMSQKETATEVIEGLKTDLAPFAGLVWLFSPLQIPHSEALDMC